MSKEDISSLLFFYIVGGGIVAVVNLLWFRLAFSLVAPSHQEAEYLMDWVGFVALISTLMMAILVTAIICFTTYKYKQLQLIHERQKRLDDFAQRFDEKQEQQLRTTIR